MTFILKGMSYLVEMLFLNGTKGITELLESLCPGTESYNKAQFGSNYQQVHEKLTALFASTFNQEVTKQKLLHNNPFMCSTFYWMIFDDGFVKMGDLLSKTMMGENSSVWQKGFGGQFIRSLMLTSFDKAAYTKVAWLFHKRSLICRTVRIGAIGTGAQQFHFPSVTCPCFGNRRLTAW